MSIQRSEFSNLTFHRDGEAVDTNRSALIDRIVKSSAIDTVKRNHEPVYFFLLRQRLFGKYEKVIGHIETIDKGMNITEERRERNYLPYFPMSAIAKDPIPQTIPEVRLHCSTITKELSYCIQTRKREFLRRIYFDAGLHKDDLTRSFTPELTQDAVAQDIMSGLFNRMELWKQAHSELSSERLDEIFRKIKHTVNQNRGSLYPSQLLLDYGYPMYRTDEIGISYQVAQAVQLLTNKNISLNDFLSVGLDAKKKKKNAESSESEDQVPERIPSDSVGFREQLVQSLLAKVYPSTHEKIQTSQRSRFGAARRYLQRLVSRDTKESSQQTTQTKTTDFQDREIVQQMLEDIFSDDSIFDMSMPEYQKLARELQSIPDLHEYAAIGQEIFAAEQAHGEIDFYTSLPNQSQQYDVSTRLTEEDWYLQYAEGELIFSELPESIRQDLTKPFSIDDQTTGIQKGVRPIELYSRLASDIERQFTLMYLKYMKDSQIPATEKAAMAAYLQWIGTTFMQTYSGSKYESELKKMLDQSDTLEQRVHRLSGQPHKEPSGAAIDLDTLLGTDVSGRTDKI